MKYIFLSILFCTFLYVTPSYSYYSLDSLKRIVLSQTDTVKINTLIKIAFTEKSCNLIKDEKKFNEIIDLSKKLDFHKGIAHGFTLLGTYYDDHEKYQMAIQCYKKSDSIWTENKNSKYLANSKLNLARTYFHIYDYQKALQYTLLALKTYEANNQQEQISICFNLIGEIYDNQKRNDKALEYYLKALAIAKKSNNNHAISSLINNIGNIYLNQENYAKALMYYTESLKMDSIRKDTFNIAGSYSNIGNIYCYKKDFEKAEKYFMLFLSISEKAGYTENYSNAYHNIAGIYLDKKEYGKAIDYFNKAYNFLENKRDWKLVKIIYGGLADAYAESKNFALAYEYSAKYSEVNDSLFNGEIVSQITEMQTKYESEKKEKEIQILTKDKENQDLKLKKNRILIISFIVGLALLLLLLILISGAYRNKKRTSNILKFKNNEIEEKNEELLQQNEEIRTQRDEIESQRNEISAQRDLVTHQKSKIEHIHKELTDSILYALQIQTSILPGRQNMQERISGDFFVLFKPKDIVSGDFYFVEKRKEWLLISVADCTGHGVPGAFMSMLGISFLNEIIAKENVRSAAQVLDELREHVIHSLQQKGVSGEQKDGMDIAFVVINTLTNEMQFSGANNSCWIVKNQNSHLHEAVIELSEPVIDLACREPAELVEPVIELVEIKGDKMPVAIHERMDTFSNHSVQLQKGDIFYLMSDGYADQFGGPKGKKFFSKNLRQLLLANSQLQMNAQKEILDNTIEDWKSNHNDHYEQTDDITILGVRILQ